MHREPYEVVPRRDLWVDGFVINVRSYDRLTGDITIPVAAPGPSICEHLAVIPRSRYGEFWIWREWRTSTELGGRFVQLGALAFLAPIWIGSDLLRASGVPTLERLGSRMHPKRGR